MIFSLSRIHFCLNQIKPKLFQSRRNSFSQGGHASCLRECFDAMLLSPLIYISHGFYSLVIVSTQTFRGAIGAGGQLRGHKQRPFSGRAYRKVPESGRVCRKAEEGAGKRGLECEATRHSAGHATCHDVIIATQTQKTRHSRRRHDDIIATRT